MAVLLAHFWPPFIPVKANVSIHKGLDILAICATPGLFFGRIANFINAELVGRPTNHPFGMVFPGAGDIPRHPSQLYEAGLEGLLLFVILYWLIQRHYNEGRIFSTSVIGYGVIRFFIEFTRAPDAHLGLLAGQLSMGAMVIDHNDNYGRSVDIWPP